MHFSSIGPSAIVVVARQVPNLIGFFFVLRFGSSTSSVTNSSPWKDIVFDERHFGKDGTSVEVLMRDRVRQCLSGCLSLGLKP